MFKEIVNLIFLYIPGRVIISPLAYLFPRKGGPLIFMGRFLPNEKGKFRDNVKYLFLYMYRKGERNIYFFSGDKTTIEALKEKGIPVIKHPSFRSVILLLRARILIVDSSEWIRGIQHFLLEGAKKAQLWHGVGYKLVELCKWKSKNPILNIIRTMFKVIKGSAPVYDFIASTSDFYTENLFSKCFKWKKIVETGQPRNDVFFRTPDEFDMIGTDSEAFEKIKKWKSLGYSVILYAPTFRKNEKKFPLDLYQFNEFLGNHRIGLIIKKHPVNSYTTSKELFENIFFHDPSADVYPLLPMIDLLITDYSSIYVDFLLLKKPVIFFPYDYEEYIKTEGEFQFDYNEMTPGIKCYNQQQLEKSLIEILIKKKDSWMVQREKILELAYKYKDGNASDRVYKSLEEF